MLERLVETRSIRPADGRAHQERHRDRALTLSLPLFAMQMVLAYEWLLSGIDKVADPSFGAQLPVVLRDSTLVNRYGWYSHILRAVVIPNARLLGPAVEFGELAIGVVLIISGALWLWSPRARHTVVLGYLACGALVGSILLSLNYSFQQGAPMPWVDSAQALSPGLGIDMLIALLSIPLLAANVLMLRSRAARS